MKTPIILNESNSIGVTGPLDVFKTASDLEIYVEPWSVDEPSFIFDSDGMQLEMTTDGRRVRLVAKEPKVFNPVIARMYFATFLRRIGTVKGWHYVGVTEDAIEHGTLSELAEQSSKFFTP